MLHKVSILGAIVLVTLGAASSARANDPAGAQALYDEGRALSEQGRWGDACPKFEESNRLDPGVGAEFHLAQCYEHVGRTASAWAMYLEAAATAKHQAQGAREKAARDKAAALEPRLARLSVRVHGAAPGLVILRDTTTIGQGQWDSPLPVDPGEHVIRASAPGKRAWEQRVTVADRPATVAVDVPPLEDGPAQGPAATPAEAERGAPRAPESRGSGQRALGIVAIVLGVGGAGVGTGFGIASRSKHDDSNAHCTGNTCDATGIGLRDDAIRYGNISTVAFGLGAVALVGGVVLFATAPSGSEVVTTGNGLAFRRVW